MLQSKSSQFTLSAEGKILWQEKVNNPLDGVEIATLAKGDALLRPVINIIDNEHTASQDKVMLRNHLSLWLRTYFMTVLEKLVLLEVPAGAKISDDPVSRIAQKVYDNLGVVPREDIQDDINQLTEEQRAELRAKHIRLGPILVFMPMLNKPAAVRLRALLWCIYHARDLPAKVPADGIVSVRVEEDQLSEEVYYRAISYPLYGGRAIRIDMLDRMLNAVYEAADKGKFQAQHQMAEWLGTTIEDLYKVLESIGHTKIYDPAEQIKKEGNQEEETVEPQDVPALEDDTATEGNKETEGASENKLLTSDAKSPRPELATFRLKSGRAYERKSSGDSRTQKHKQDRKTFQETKKQSSRDEKTKNKKKPYNKNKKQNAPRIMSAEAKNKKEEDSPFAILQQLKK